MNLKGRYEDLKREGLKSIISTALIIYLVAIFSGYVLKVLNFELDKDSLFWTTSTIIQAFGALLALSAVYSIYRIQNYEKDLADSKTKVIFLIKRIARETKVVVPIKFDLPNKGEAFDYTLKENDIELLKSFEHNKFLETIQKYQREVEESNTDIDFNFHYWALDSSFNEYNKIVNTIKDYKKSIKYSLYLIGANISFALLFLPQFTIKSSNPIISLFLEESVVILFLIFFSAYCLLALVLSIKSSIGNGRENGKGVG